MDPILYFRNSKYFVLYLLFVKFSKMIIKDKSIKHYRFKFLQKDYFDLQISKIILKREE